MLAVHLKCFNLILSGGYEIAISCQVYTFTKCKLCTYDVHCTCWEFNLKICTSVRTTWALSFFSHLSALMYQLECSPNILTLQIKFKHGLPWAQIRFTTNVISSNASTESRCSSCRTRFSTKSYHHGNLFFPFNTSWTKAFAFLI